MNRCRTPKQENKPAQEKRERRPAQKEDKDLIQKECRYCGKIFTTDNVQKEYCCKDHKDTAYNEKRRKERRENKSIVEPCSVSTGKNIQAP